MDINNLEKIFSPRPPFQLRQAKQAVFRTLIDDWTQATNLAQKLREELNKECPLEIKAEIFPSEDKNTIKSLINLKDGLKVETVLMRHKPIRLAQGEDGRNTVCVSSQIGCPLGCVFCATGRMGLKRNLEPMEIVEQVLFFTRYLKKNNQRVDNIVFMGMGEPFLNYENVLTAIKILNDKNGLNIGARHISVSTVGITEGIEKLSNEPLQINLAISLHASNDELRSKIIPANKKYPINKIFLAVKSYIEKTGRRVMFEYIMIKGINDAPERAKELAGLIKKQKLPLYFINLISCNPTGIFQPSPADKIKTFKKILENNKITVTQRHRFGQEIKGACGQLAGK